MNSHLLLLVSDTNVSSKPLTDHGKQEQLHYTTGGVIKIECICYYLLSSIISSSA